MKKSLYLIIFIPMILVAASTGVIWRRGGGGSSAAPAITLVQSNSGDAGTVSSADVNFLSNPTSGNLIVVAVRAGGVSVNTVTTTDGTNTYNVVISSYSTGPSTLYIGYAKNITGGALTINIALGTSATLRWSIHEYSGCSTSAPLDQSAAAEGVSTDPNSGSRTTVAANEVIFGAVGVAAGGQDITAGASFTERQEVGQKLQTEDRIVSSASSYSASWTVTLPDTWLAGMATFK